MFKIRKLLHCNILFSMETMARSTSIDAAMLKLMRQIYSQLLNTTHHSSHEILLLEQKIIFTSIILFQTSIQSTPLQKQQLGTLIVNFVQKINKLSMQSYQGSIKKKQGKGQQKLLNRSISLLMNPSVELYVSSAVLVKLKIVNFNNLTCILKKLGKLGIALRSINYALQLEQGIIQDKEQKYDIIATYLNKAAILSEMKKHRQAMDVIWKAKAHIQGIQVELGRQIQGAIEEREKQRLIQKRHYGLYMKMIVLYNMGAQKEHLRTHSQAIDYYRQSKQVATLIGNQLMIGKLTSVINALLPA